MGVVDGCTGCGYKLLRVAFLDLDCHSWPSTTGSRQVGTVGRKTPRGLVGGGGGGGVQRGYEYLLEFPFAELRSCVKVEVAVLGSPSLIVRTVSVDVKQH